MNEALIVILTVTVPSAITLWLGWYFGRKKANAEAKISELEAVEKALSIYRAMIADLSNEIKKLQDKVERLEKTLHDTKTI